jgi:hypothetical protein
MTRLTLDDFIEGFAAKLVGEGRNVMRLNDPSVRDGLYRVYRMFEELLTHTSATDREWRRSLVNIKSIFQPSAIGSFDRFEALMRAKQVYLTDHPNPYYQDIRIQIPTSTAKQIVEHLAPSASDLVSRSVEQYLES